MFGALRMAHISRVYRNIVYIGTAKCHPLWCCGGTNARTRSHAIYLRWSTRRRMTTRSVYIRTKAIYIYKFIRTRRKFHLFNIAKTFRSYAFCRYLCSLCVCVTLKNFCSMVFVVMKKKRSCFFFPLNIYTLHFKAIENNR